MSALLDAVLFVPGRRHEDGRGWLAVPFARSRLPAQLRFAEVYLVSSDRAGQRRGDHYHRRAWEAFAVVEGRGRLELLDPQTGEARSLELGSSSPLTVVVPPGLAHALVAGEGGRFVAAALSSEEHDPGDVVPCSAAATPPRGSW